MFKLKQGNCLELMPQIPSGSVDMILCDLPYGTTACKWDTVIPFEPLWAEYKRIIKKNGAIVLFGQEPFSSVMRMSNLKDYKYDWIWDKSGSHFKALKDLGWRPKTKFSLNSHSIVESLNKMLNILDGLHTRSIVLMVNQLVF